MHFVCNSNNSSGYLFWSWIWYEKLLNFHFFIQMIAENQLMLWWCFTTCIILELFSFVSENIVNFVILFYYWIENMRRNTDNRLSPTLSRRRRFLMILLFVEYLQFCVGDRRGFKWWLNSIAIFSSFISKQCRPCGMTSLSDWRIYIYWFVLLSTFRLECPSQEELQNTFLDDEKYILFWYKPYFGELRAEYVCKINRSKLSSYNGMS